MAIQHFMGWIPIKTKLKYGIQVFYDLIFSSILLNFKRNFEVFTPASFPEMKINNILIEVCYSFSFSYFDVNLGNGDPR